MLLDSPVNFVKNMTVVVPFVINDKLNDIKASLGDSRANMEYGIFLVCTVDLQKQLVIVSDKPEDIYIPKQKVTAATIEFLEDVPDPRFNMVIHRHPNGATRFSSVDNEYINQMFDVSLIFIPPNTYPDAIVNIRTADNSFVQLVPNVIVSKPKHADLTDEVTLKIISPKPPQVRARPNVGNHVSINRPKRCMTVNPDMVFIDGFTKPDASVRSKQLDELGLHDLDSSIYQDDILTDDLDTDFDDFEDFDDFDESDHENLAELMSLDHLFNNG